MSTSSQLAEQFELMELRTDAILVHTGRRKPITPPIELQKVMHTAKTAAAAVIVSPHDVYAMRDLEDLPIGLQVRNPKVSDGNTNAGTLECPGGGFLSDQELNHIRTTKGMTIANAPGSLFYDVLFKRLMDEGGQVSFNYTDLKGNVRLIKNVRQEISAEMGRSAANKIRTIRKLNTAPKITDLQTISFGNERNQQLVDTYGDEFNIQTQVSPNPVNTIVTGFTTRIKEDVLWADVDNVRDVANSTRPTEEADGMYVYTVGELLALFKKATEGDCLDEKVVSWDQFKIRHPGLMRPRAPSTAWQIRMLFEYLDRTTNSNAKTTISTPVHSAVTV